MASKFALCVKMYHFPSHLKKKQRGGVFSEEEVKYLANYFQAYIEWKKTPSLTACREYLERYPNEKGRTDHDIQKKFVRMYSK